MTLVEKQDPLAPYRDRVGLSLHSENDFLGIVGMGGDDAIQPEKAHS
jgi:hypothetical protein